MQPEEQPKIVLHTPYYVWVLGFFYIIWGALFLYAYNNEMSTTYLYSYEVPNCAPGTLTSMRWGKYYWVAYLAAVARFVFFMVTRERIAWHATKGITRFHLIVGLVYLVVEVVNAVVWGRAMQFCNQEDFNPCNDYRICGVNASNFTTCPKNYCPSAGNLTEFCIHGSGGATNSCSFVAPTDVCSFPNTTTDACSLVPTVISWDPPVTYSDLGQNAQYKTSFWLSITFALFALLILAVSVFSKTAKKIPQGVTYIGIGNRQRNDGSDFNEGSGDDDNDAHFGNKTEDNVGGKESNAVSSWHPSSTAFALPSVPTYAGTTDFSQTNNASPKLHDNYFANFDSDWS
jgi:hypothetical protein